MSSRQRLRIAATYSAEMESPRVDVGGVQALAGRTEGLADELVGGSAPTELGASGWSCSAAVNPVHAAATTTTDALAARTQTTAPKIAAADASFVAREASSAAELAAVGKPVTV